MKLKNIGIGDFIEAKNKHGGDVGFDILEIGKSYEVLGLNENSDFTVVISVPEHKTFCSGFYVCHEYFRKPRPQLKQLDQYVFDGLDEKWRFAAVDKDGAVAVYLVKPISNHLQWYVEDTSAGISYKYFSYMKGYDTSNWQNSLIERDTAELLEVDLSSEPTGSELCKAMLARGDKCVLIRMGARSDKQAKEIGRFAIATSIDESGRFNVMSDQQPISKVDFAVPINNQGEPLTASEAGL